MEDEEIEAIINFYEEDQSSTIDDLEEQDDEDTEYLRCNECGTPLPAELANPFEEGERPRPKNWLLYARPCITCHAEDHCSRNCASELEIVQQMAREDATYIEALTRFVAQMPFSFNIYGEVIGMLGDKDHSKEQENSHSVCTTSEGTGKDQQNSGDQSENGGWVIFVICTRNR